MVGVPKDPPGPLNSKKSLDRIGLITRPDADCEK